ncbi:hypothetical protein IAE22_33365, partial [Bacillus sp. S34]|nr:hypothetical protein [Bacillus sp. S34]
MDEIVTRIDLTRSANELTRSAWTNDSVLELLEYLPYRLDDWTAPRDSERHPWYAAHGYAS